MCRGCSPAAEDMAFCGFESRRVLGFFRLLPFPTFLHQWSVLNKVPQESASLTGFCERAVLPGQNKLRLAQLGVKNFVALLKQGPFMRNPPETQLDPELFSSSF